MCFFTIKLDKDTALEFAVVVAAESDCVDGTVGREEGFDVCLCRGAFFGEPFCVDAARDGFVFIEGPVALGIGADFLG